MLRHIIEFAKLGRLNRATLCCLPIFLLFVTTASMAETRDVFVVVDVSASVPQAKNQSTRTAVQSMIADAQKLVIDLVSANFSPADYPNWKWNEQLLVTPLKEIVTNSSGKTGMSGQGKQVAMLPFGDKEVTHRPTFSPPIEQFPADFADFVKRDYPKDYKDQQTYVTLARAGTAELAETLQIDRYYFFMVTDAVQDPKAQYSEKEERLLRRWDSENFVASKTRIGLFEYAGAGLEDRGFQIDVWKVDLDLPPAISRIVCTNPSHLEVVGAGPLKVNWTISHDHTGERSQPSGYSFYLSAVESDSGRVVHSVPVSDSYSASLPFEKPGKYRLTISGNQTTPANAQVQPRAPGRAEVEFTVGSQQALILSSATKSQDFLAGQESNIEWQLQGDRPPGSPALNGEFKLTVIDMQDNSRLVTHHTAAFNHPVSFANPGDYRIEVAFVGPNEGNQVLPLSEVITVGFPKARLLLTTPKPPSDGSDFKVKAPEGELTLSWEPEAGSNANTKEGEFLITLADENGLPVASTPAKGGTAILSVPDSGDYILKIAGKGALASALTPIAAKISIDTSSLPGLKFLLPRNQSKGKSKKVTFRWSAPKGVKVEQYRLKVTGPQSINQVVPTTGFAKTFSKPGRYTARVSVSSPKNAANLVKEANVSFTIESGGSGMLWFLIIFLLGGAGVYFYLKKKKQNASSSAARKSS